MAMTNRPPVYPEIFVGALGTPFEALYKYDNALNLTPYPMPADIANTVLGHAIRKDGKFVGICHANKFQLYRRSNGAFIRVTITNDVTYTNPQDAHFSDDGSWLIVSYLASPYFMLYQRAPDDSTYVRLTTNLPVVPSRTYCSAISPDGNHVIVGLDLTPYIKMFSWNGSTYNNVITPPTIFNAQIYDTAYSKDGSILALATYNSFRNLQILKNNFDGTYTKLTDTVNNIFAGAAHGVAISPDNQHIAITGIVAPYCAIYKWDGATLTHLANTPTTLTAQGWRLNYSPDGKYLAISESGGSGLPGVHIWQRVGDTYTEIATIPTVGTSTRSVAWGPAPT
jgi:WD40 repeat protein